MSSTPPSLDGTVDVVLPAPVVATRIPWMLPPRVPVRSPVEEYTRNPLGVQILTVAVRSSRTRVSTTRCRPADAPSDIGASTSALVSSGAMCFFTLDAAAFSAAFTPLSMPPDFRNHAPAATAVVSTAMPPHIRGRPTEIWLLDATAPPPGTAEEPSPGLNTPSFGTAGRRPEPRNGGWLPAPNGGHVVLRRDAWIAGILGAAGCSVET